MPHISATCPATLASSARNRICNMTDQPIIETFEIVEWKDFPNAPGVQYVDVEGSISSPGPFLARVRFPGGIDTPPHRHAAPFIDRNTVISGTLFVGIGETFDKSKGIAVPPGGVVAIPPGVAHFAWSDEETVVHVHGEGPWLPTA
jgi:quercetin dioxygenase-like cupin family protein